MIYSYYVFFKCQIHANKNKNSLSIENFILNINVKNGLKRSCSFCQTLIFFLMNA